MQESGKFIACDVESYIPDQIKPDCKIPMLNDAGWVLSDSHAILRYLATETWYPVEAQKRAIVDQWLGWQGCRLGLKASEYAALEVFGNKIKPVSVELNCWLDVLLNELNHALGQQPFVAGTDATIADLSIAASVWYLELAAFPFQSLNHVQTWFDRLKTRPAFKANVPECL